MTNIPPSNTGSQKRLEQAIDDLLHKIPETWQEYRMDDLTETQSKAQSFLVGAGMVERQGCFRLRMINQPLAVDATFKATGEDGLNQALGYLYAAIWGEWKEAYDKWKNIEAKDTVPIHCELLQPEKWRLTEMGVMAKENFDKGQKRDVCDFVLKQGIYDGQPRLMPTGQRIHRIPVSGRGSLVKIEKKPVPDHEGSTTEPQTMNIGNWDEGCEKLGQAIASILDQKSKEKPPLKPKGRMKRSQSEPLIAAHLARRPHDITQDVADAVGCSKGVVAESPSWKANQKRRADAKKKGKDPIELRLEDYLSPAGDKAQSQVFYQNEQQESIDDDIDRREQELFDRIGEYIKNHPGATVRQTAKAVGCTAGEVERRERILNRLIQRQKSEDKMWIDNGKKH